MSKLACSIAAAMLCAGSMLPWRAEAMIFGAPKAMRAASDATSAVERAACGWYPSGYPQSWAVYTRGWGCRYAYSPYYYDPYVYRPYYGVYDSPLGYRSGPYWRPRTWWWSWY
jgi:hypothetical protein